jgi:pimeloyl-ACP methyl ester carboxylesterase
MRFVLIHGAFSGGWVWGPLAELLQARGHTVEAPDLPGGGQDRTPVAEVTLDAYAQRICDVVSSSPEPVVLAGHSMGGMAITQAAPRCADRIASMVYVAAFLPQEGESLIALTQLPEGEGDQVQANLVVEGDPPVATMPAEASRAATYAHCSDELAAWAIASRTPQPVFPFTEPVSLGGFDFGEIPRAYVYCSEDRAIPPPLQRRMIAAAGCEPVIELKTDHVPQLSRTAELAEALDRLAA